MKIHSSCAHNIRRNDDHTHSNSRSSSGGVQFKAAVPLSKRQYPLLSSCNTEHKHNENASASSAKTSMMKTEKEVENGAKHNAERPEYGTSSDERVMKRTLTPVSVSTEDEQKEEKHKETKDSFSRTRVRAFLHCVRTLFH